MKIKKNQGLCNLDKQVFIDAFFKFSAYSEKTHFFTETFSVKMVEGRGGVKMPCGKTCAFWMVIVIIYSGVFFVMNK